jgi:competence protein ComEC
MGAAPAPGPRIEAALARQRAYLACWTPVCLGAGIGIWFALSREPGAAIYGGVAGLAALCLALRMLLCGLAGRVLAMALLLICVGFLLAGARAHSLSAPVLGFRYYGPIEGRIVDVDRSQSDRLRITLDRLRLEDVRGVPHRARLSLHGDHLAPLAPGTRVMTTGHLSPPPGPAEPGGFDFRRHAWFLGLGAVGYSRVPLLLASDAPAKGAWLARLRVRLSAAIRSRIGGEAGGFAAAVTTGDRSGLGRAANDAMREANLYHLVSISGMHMAMLAGFVFWLVRAGVAALPPVALRLNGRKVAAAMALPAAAFYLALAGRDVATERAFIMVAVSLGSVLADRRALSLRGLAIAALIVLGLRPETLLNPGFQMSFAAVLALVVAMGRLPSAWHRPRGLARLWMPIALLSLTSLVAGSATAPFAAAHFNRVAHYGLLANLLAVPAMGGLVMPGAVILAVTGPLGLDQPAVWMIDWGSRWILWVSARIAELDGASSAVIAPPGAVVALVAFGWLWGTLWQGRGRVAALLPLALAAGLWARAERPDLLISDSGALLGLMTPEGRALSKPTGDGFAAGVWLENDGDGRSQSDAHDPRVLPRHDRLLRISFQGTEIVQVTGKTALAKLQGCGGADILITNQPGSAPRPCLRFDATRLRDTGALALWQGPDGPRIETVAERAGRRLWTQ